MSLSARQSFFDDARFVEAAATLGAIAVRNVPFGVLTTYRVGGNAAIMARPRTVDDLQLIAEVLHRFELPAVVIGRGSNMLIADAGFGGIAISLVDMAADHVIDGTDVVAGACVALPQLARRMSAAGLTGFEWAVGVPGSIGGAVRMNAGGHGSDIAACLVDAHIIDLHTGAEARVPAASLGLRFRGSDLADHQVVVDARLRLSAGDRLASETELNEIVRWRREHQPGGQNAGSVFVNPIPGELSAGELIDQVGLRGTVLGTASVSDKHANFIQGSDGGSAADVVALIESVRAAVAEQTGFVLRSEVRLVGFDDVAVDINLGVHVPHGDHQGSNR
ncbi:MAG: UDP-N-acetylmuramate dehydrogenase [Ilumatobacteraceae bacterium]